MFKFLFGGSTRLDDVESKARQLAVDNRNLRAKISRLELALISRRADDIVGARDCLIPVPRPGSSAARLLGQNKALRKRAKAAEERAEHIVEAAVVDMFAVADNLEQRGQQAVAVDVRQRAEALVAKVRDAVAPMASSTEVSTDLYADHVRETWARVDHVKAADDWLARIHALEPSSSRGKPAQPADVAAIAGLVVATLLTSGPVEAADVIRGSATVTVDLFAVGAEAVLYALALALGDAWTEDVRTAWCLAIEDVSKACGFPGNGAAIFSMEESLDVS